MGILSTERSKCLFCRFATPTTLFNVDINGGIHVLSERESIKAAAQALKPAQHNEIQVYYDLAKSMAAFNECADRHVARVFRNLTPALDATIGEWCTVTSLNPAYHEYEFHDLPAAAIRALVRAWQVQEQLARAQSLSFIGFVNGGKRPESGQSVACCHGQTFAVKTIPELYAHIASRREREYNGKCPMCSEILSPAAIEHYGVWCPEQSGFVLLAHPAPLHNWSLLLVSRKHVEHLSDVDAQQFAAMLQAAVRALRGQFGEEPAFNIVIRTGGAVGHLHAEIVPRTGVNVLAGWEIAGREVVITVDPLSVPEQLSLRVP